jgi:hypothetical protein
VRTNITKDLYEVSNKQQSTAAGKEERKGRVMTSNRSTEIDQSLEKDIGASIHALTRNSEALRPPDGNGDMSGDNLGALLRRMSEASTHEVESLIGELHELRKKLEIDGKRIQSEIAKYTELSQGVIQLTTIISDSVRKLPNGPPSPDLRG